MGVLMLSGRILLCFLASLCFSASGIAQSSGDYLFDHYGPVQGLHSSEVIDIIQSSDHYLWLATDVGLVRYDGHTFRYYTHDIDDTTTLANDYTKRLLEDRYDRIWVIAGKGIDILYPESDSFVHVRIITEEGRSTLINARSLEYNAAGDTMWLSSEGGLYYSTGENAELHSVRIEGLEPIQCDGFLTLDKQKKLLLSSSYGLYRIDPSGQLLQTFQHPLHDWNYPSSHGFFYHYEDKNDVLWSGNWTNGLSLFTENETIQTFRYSQDGLNTVYSIAETTHQPGLLFLGTIHGLMTFDKSSHTFNEKILASNEFQRDITPLVFVIREFGDALWIGSGNGLYCLDFTKHLFSQYEIPGLRSEVFQLSDVQFERLASEENMIWFDIPYLGAFRYDLNNERLAEIPTVLRSYTEGAAGVHGVYIDSRQWLWISSDRYGLSAFDLKKGALQIRSTITTPHPRMLGIQEGADGRIWCTSPDGLWYIRPEHTQLIQAKEVKDAIVFHKKSLFTASPQMDSKGRIWFVSGWSNHVSDAVYCYDPSNNETRFIDQESSDAIRRVGHIEGVFVSSTGTCIAYGERGLAIAQLERNERIDSLDFTYFNPGHYCFSVSEDNDRRLWVSIKTGILMIDPENFRIVTFTHFNSTIGNTPQPSVTFSPLTNRLYVGQREKISVLDLNSHILPECGAPVLSALSVKDKQLRGLPASGESLKLRHWQNVLHFAFTNFSYTDSELNTYAFRLDPDDPWEKTADNRIHLNSLSYGDYVLEVQTANAFGVAAKDVYRLNIQIAPPFSRTWWFTALIFILSILAIYLIYRFRLAQLERLNNIRLAIARDLHDDMGGNLSQVKILSEIEATKAGSNPVFQKINSKLATIMDSMSEIVWSINPQKDNLREIILHIQEYAVGTLEPKQINIHFNIDPIPGKLRFNIDQRRHFYLLFKEAINNIAKYSRAENVTFELHFFSGKMKTSIADDGVGFDPAQITYGNGLKNMRSRAEFLGGELNIQTSDKGTSITLLKPIRRRIFM